MKKIKQIIVCGLAIYPLLIYGCNTNKKNNVLETSGSYEIMNIDSNCMLLNNMAFKEKDALFRFLNEERIEFFKGGPGSFGISIGYSASSFIFPLFSYWLEKKSYHPISESIFKARVKEVFNINLSDKNEKIIPHGDFIEYWTDSAYEVEGGDIMSEGSFLFSSKYKLFFRPPFNEELVEEIGSSEQYQTCFEEKEYHYNNFILNNSKASLTWLIKNDIEFLEILIREFSYDKEPKINKVVLNKVNKEYQAANSNKNEILDDLFVRRLTNGELDIRDGLFESIIEITTSTNKDVYEMLGDNMLSLVLDDSKSPLQLSIEERAKLLALFASMENKLYAKYYKAGDWNYYTTTRGILKNVTPNYQEIWKENNYYNILDFQNVLESLDFQDEPI